MTYSTTIRENKAITSPEALYCLLKVIARKKQEHFIVLTLDSAAHPIKRHLVTIGLVNRTIVHPREVFRPAILDNAAAIAVAHNHPSGNLTASSEATELTQRLKKAAEIIGIKFIDHLILGKNGFFSFEKSIFS